MIGAVICELISLAVIGPGAGFPYGLVLGLAIAIIGMRLLSATLEAASQSCRSGSVILGYLVRILLYAFALYLCAVTGTAAFFGCIAGLLLPRAALTFGQLAMPKIRKALDKEEAETEHFIAVTEPASRLFVKSQAMMKYQSGRAYLTHRHFKHYKLVETQPDGIAEQAVISGFPPSRE